MVQLVAFKPNLETSAWGGPVVGAVPGVSTCMLVAVCGSVRGGEYRAVERERTRDCDEYWHRICVLFSVLFSPDVCVCML